VRRAVCLALLLAVTVQPLASQERGSRLPRRWLIAGVGALVMGTVAGVYALTFDQDIGGCSRATCVVPVSVALGFGIGFMIGKEIDDLYAVRYSHAPPIDLRGRELPLAVLPSDLVVRDSAVLVTGSEGVEVVRAGPLLERLGIRARGLRGIGPVLADEPRNLLLVGSAVGLYRFPMLGEEAGTLAHAREISALSADGAWLALGLGPAVQIARMTDSLTPAADPVPEDARVMDLAWQGDSLLWVLTEERLASYARDGDTLRPIGALPFPTIARRLALGPVTALVAAGSGGVFAVDVRDPAAPVEVGNWSGARFAYDVAVAGDTVYVAAGPEGLYLLHLDATGFRSVGLSRGVGFVAAVEAGADAIYVLDRAGAALRRLDRRAP
jgi:hypothetical protein